MRSRHPPCVCDHSLSSFLPCNERPVGVGSRCNDSSVEAAPCYCRGLCMGALSTAASSRNLLLASCMLLRTGADAGEPQAFQSTLYPTHDSAFCLSIAVNTGRARLLSHDVHGTTSVQPSLCATPALAPSLALLNIPHILFPYPLPITWHLLKAIRCLSHPAAYIYTATPTALTPPPACQGQASSTTSFWT